MKCPNNSPAQDTENEIHDKKGAQEDETDKVYPWPPMTNCGGYLEIRKTNDLSDWIVLI